MRRIRYQVACSLDGFIAGPAGEYDWIPPEPEFDFPALFRQFDTLLVGRRTYEQIPDLAGQFADKEIIVFSGSLRGVQGERVKVVAPGQVADAVPSLKSRPGKDIWLFGGGELFRSLLELGLVDTVEPAVMPVVLGAGKRLLPETAGSWKLELARSQLYPTSGMMLLEYRVVGRIARAGNGSRPSA